MSDESAPRALRIIPAPPLSDATALQPGTLRQAERFQRTLLQSSRPAAAATRASRSEPAAGARLAAGATEAPPSSEAQNQAATTGKRTSSHPDAPARGRPLAAQPAVECSSGAAHAETGYAPGHADDGAIDPDQEGAGGWSEDLVRAIALLCRQTDPAIEAWSVTVPLNADVLPDTELQLSLSRYRLSLRFITQSRHSHQLLSEHWGSLAAMLRKALPQDRDIDIEVT